VRTTIGIDIGGTGIKAAIVDIDSGTLASERLKEATPSGAAPHDVAAVVARLVEQLDPQGSLPIGAAFPAIIVNEVALSAANVSAEWINLHVGDLLEKATGRPTHVVNDADAAGYAESQFGAAKGVKGLVIVTTLGTGIGSAFIYNGVLLPNTELGHIPLHNTKGRTAEQYAANSVRERKQLSFPRWAKRLTKFYGTLAALFTPQLFVVGGGVSKQHQEFLPLISVGVPIVPATHLNNAGILGAAALAPFHD
jgi:polyphosphate glucokinase